MAEVSIVDFAFSPAQTAINVNDSVRWTWIGNAPHSTTSSSNPRLWDSDIHGHGFTFVNTFASAGQFPYFCRVHPFMTGSIKVQIPTNSPPVMPTPIRLINPQRLSAKEFQFDYTADPGLRYAVERSTRLPNFTPIATNSATSSTVSFRDNAAPLDRSFYRVRLLTNP